MVFKKNGISHELFCPMDKVATIYSTHFNTNYKISVQLSFIGSSRLTGYSLYLHKHSNFIKVPFDRARKSLRYSCRTTINCQRILLL